MSLVMCCILSPVLWSTVSYIVNLVLLGACIVSLMVNMSCTCSVLYCQSCIISCPML